MQAILAQAGEDCVGCRGRSKVVHQDVASIRLRCIDVQLLFSEDMFFKPDYVSTSLEDDARRREIWLGKSPVGDMSAAVSSCGCAGRTVWLRIFLERVLPTRCVCFSEYFGAHLVYVFLTFFCYILTIPFLS